MNLPVQVNTNGHEFRQSTDAAGLCGAIVKQTAKDIQGRRFVSCEGWQAIAIAHGCTAGARSVERVDGGIRAIGEVRRMSDGQLLATAEGFVGEDEPVWFGGPMRKWKWGPKRGEKIWYEENMPKRPDYAIRAMAQTRAISRVCRSAFAHVVVMIDAGLSTTPADEVPDGGFIEGQYEEVIQPDLDTKDKLPEGMPDAEFSKLAGLLKATGVPAGKLLKEYGVKSLRQINQTQFADAIERLNNILAEKAKEESNKSNEEFGDVVEEEVPF